MYIDEIYDYHADAYGIIQLQEQGYVATCAVSSLVILLSLVACTYVV